MHFAEHCMHTQKTCQSHIAPISLTVANGGIMCMRLRFFQSSSSSNYIHLPLTHLWIIMSACMAYNVHTKLALIPCLPVLLGRTAYVPSRGKTALWRFAAEMCLAARRHSAVMRSCSRASCNYTMLWKSAISNA